VWYNQKTLLTKLDMDERTFRRNVKRGAYPEGYVRPGEKERLWDDEDLAYMLWRAKNDWRFTPEGGDNSEDDGGK